MIRKFVTKIEAVHFQSDGSHLCRNKFEISDMAFPDGIGGAVKSICDPAILLGKDINSAAEAVQIIENSNLKTTVSIISEAQ